MRIFLVLICYSAILLVFCCFIIDELIYRIKENKKIKKRVEKAVLENEETEKKIKEWERQFKITRDELRRQSL